MDRTSIAAFNQDLIESMRAWPARPILAPQDKVAVLMVRGQVAPVGKQLGKRRAA
jgi:hypothetical protein